LAERVRLSLPAASGDRKERVFAPLCNRSVEDLIPADNFYRHLDAKLDL
jgi:hypothetical protein